MPQLAPPLPYSSPASPWLQRLFKPFRRTGQRWRGGIKLADHKALSNQTPIQQIAVKGLRIAVPLGDGRRQVEPCVVAGQQVLKGELIGRGEPMSLWAHASTSGRVAAIERAYPADRDQPVPVVIIEADGRDRWIERQPVNTPQNAAELAQFSLQMGLIGLGGAGFPTGIKIAGSQQSDLLLINGAECEPFVTCDDRLMRERADTIIAAADYLSRVLEIAQVRIGVEPNKPEALAALNAAVAATGSRVQICRLPHRYPAGGQPMLVKSLSGRTLSPGMLPAEVGVMVLNVATLHALGRAVFHGEPLVSRVVTLTGDVDKPGNVEVPIGMPVPALLAAAQPRDQQRGVQVGGPMMGRELSHPNAVISKTSSCLIVRCDDLFPPRPPAGDCIRCNRCVDVCPMALQPLKLYAASQRADRITLQQEQLAACIECGACSHVCPSNLPLRDSFRDAKRELLAGARQ
ncbi:electron transport complex subunit RsxC [Marinobacterium arenosum]|uniref:electron transport complex subunit RsxC n=1 Tax=Marinobacterium arenosum TaxID=2862496 RepID=UPI001C947F56|nr:electron transport complex subunit RsxC [Marinobacterium arenosum]MBY4678321.1 electron transport complex subunit RsxC [Marinobacterium arenosum]